MKVKKPDGTPGVGEKVEVSVKDQSQNQNFQKQAISDENGEVLFSLPPLSKDSTTVSITVSV